ncbi:MAG: hypothetical protein EOO57_06690 [Hymenobacter sp.]|nr:MAG: hypothetical protein EOO57_06690 [Hymenobacter sp.]
MAYSDFTIDRLSTEFGVDFQGANLFSGVGTVVPSEWLAETLTLANQLGFGNEKSRSERLISPILTELARRNAHTFTIVSGGYLDVDPARGLNGECDFVLSYVRLHNFIKAPVFCVAEAKKQDMDQGTVQCAAQLIGAARFNEREKKVIPTLYGCATTGVEWQFLKLEGTVCTLDEARYYTLELPKLLGVLQHIVDQTKPQL